MKMSGLWKASPLTLAVMALSLITASCNTNTTGNGAVGVRVIDAVPDGPAIDVYFNGSKIFTNVVFAVPQPNTAPASYLTGPAGSVSIQGFQTGTTTNAVAPIGIAPFQNGIQYTVVAVGLEANESAPMVLADDNSAPVGTNVEVRAIDASNNSPLGGLDVYIVPPTTQDLTNFTPQITSLNNNQASGYQNLSFLSGGYSVIFTAHNSKTPIITQPITANASSITTLVILDNPGGTNGMSTTPLVLNDLN